MLGGRLRRRNVSMSRRMTAAVGGQCWPVCVLIERLGCGKMDTASEAEGGDKGNKAGHCRGGGVDSE